jgi:hypothetical protein
MHTPSKAVLLTILLRGPESVRAPQSTLQLLLVLANYLNRSQGDTRCAISTRNVLCREIGLSNVAWRTVHMADSTFPLSLQSPF